MDRRDFLQGSAAAVLSAMLTSSRHALAATYSCEVPATTLYAPFLKNGPDPAPEITAAVDVLVPADPDIPGDFVGSDYGADRIVAASLGDTGQSIAVMFLDGYAQDVAGRTFLECSEEERLDAIKQWIRERDDLDLMFRPLLSGLLTLAVVGTYEGNSEAEQLEQWEAMNWYDPADPLGTFMVPNEGYPDAALMPVHLRLESDDD